MQGDRGHWNRSPSDTRRSSRPSGPPPCECAEYRTSGQRWPATIILNVVSQAAAPVAGDANTPQAFSGDPPRGSGNAPCHARPQSGSFDSTLSLSATSLRMPQKVPSATKGRGPRTTESVQRVVASWKKASTARLAARCALHCVLRARGLELRRGPGGTACRVDAPSAPRMSPRSRATAVGRWR